jgi:hypothetical protein
MGKQLSIYLDDQLAKTLAEEALRECRRPHDQARYLLRQALGIAEEPQIEPTATTQNGAGVRQDSASAVLP